MNADDKIYVSELEAENGNLKAQIAILEGRLTKIKQDVSVANANAAKWEREYFDMLQELQRRS